MKSTEDYLLALGMLITGSVNTLSTKWADNSSSKGLNGNVHLYDHPFFQALGMFVGEFSCLIVFFLLKWRAEKKGADFATAKPHSPFVFLLPACLDMCGTSLMYLGLTWTYASVFQMLRGSVVIFTGVLSVLFLKRKLMGFHWFGMFLVLVGTATVGLSSILKPASDDGAGASNPVGGDIAIIVAQVVVAVQMVVEEKFVSKHEVPALQAVGMEGFWGFSVLSLVLVGMYYIPGDRQGSFENAPDAALQVINSTNVLLATLGNLFSIAFFNFFGISVTKAMSASHRMVLDSVRTLVIWLVSLLLKWESFDWVQLGGFVVLLSGTMVYNEILKVPGFNYTSKAHEVSVLPSADGEDAEEEYEALIGSRTASNTRLRSDYYRVLNIRFDQNVITKRSSQ